MDHKEHRAIRIANQLLDFFLRDKYLEEFFGDLQEIHLERVEMKGNTQANLYYWADAIHLLFGFVSLQFFRTNQNPTIMLKHYFMIARRNLVANRRNGFINIIGLSMGIGFTLIISFIIRYELSFDTFHSNSDRIYRVVRVSQVEGETEYRTGTAWPLSPTIADEIASMEHMTYMTYWSNVQVDVMEENGRSIKSFNESSGGAFVSEAFFDIFDYRYADVEWLYGDPEIALKNPNSVVLTASLATKYFGEKVPMGKSLTINQELEMVVTGVISDLPANSNFPFTMICSYSTLVPLFNDYVMTSWSSVSDSHQTYIILPEGTTKEEMEAQIARIHLKYAGDELASMRTYPLQPLSEVHRDERFGNYQHKFTSMKNIIILALVGSFLLVMVCINFINISIASSVSRSKEIGLRKVVGGSRTQIVFQFLFETFILIIIGTCIAILAIEGIKPELQQLFGFHVEGLFISHSFVLGLILIIALLLTIAAGLYPALQQSAYTPTVTIQQSFSSKIGRKLRMSNALVLVQFTITLVLVTSTFIVMQQIQFFKSVDIGFEKEAIININLPKDHHASSLSTLRNQFLLNPHIGNISYSSTIPSGLYRGRGYMDIKKKGSTSEESLVYEYQSIDAAYLRLYDMKLLAGKHIPYTDTIRSVIINKNLMKKLGYSNFHECIGSEVDLGYDESCKVIGVINDYYDNSLRNGFGKIAMVHNPSHFSVMSVKLKPSAISNEETLSNTIKDMETKWNAMFPNDVFDYDFLDKNIEAFYQEEARFYKIFEYISIIVLIIGCMGIFGLISFIVNKKIGEIAIRKVHGASVFSILMLLLKKYVILVIAALIIAVPVVYVAMEQWMENYQYHIQLVWWYFVLPFILVLLITFLTIFRNMIKAIKLNPTVALKYE